MQQITRRALCRCGALGLLAAAGAMCIQASLLPQQAQAEEATAAALASAQAQYEAVQAQLNQLASEVSAMSIELAQTQDSIESKQIEINDTRAQVVATQAQLAEYRDELAAIMASDYKTGGASVLDVILSSASFEELTRNIYYLTKVNDHESEIIQTTWSIQRQLEDQQAALEQQLADLEALKAEQEEQLAYIQARQNDTYTLLNSVSAEVQALTDQYNAELYAKAQAAAEAQAAAAASGGTGSYGVATSSGGLGSVLSACESTPSPGEGLCAAWVSNVFVNAGYGFIGGDACDMYANYCYSSDQGALQPGMIIAVSTWPGSVAGQIYGHVGIYVGGGVVMDNVGYIRSISLSSWISTYGASVTPRWGWLGGIALS